LEASPCPFLALGAATGFAAALFFTGSAFLGSVFLAAGFATFFGFAATFALLLVLATDFFPADADFLPDFAIPRVSFEFERRKINGETTEKKNGPPHC
jgi:hypothetical protein